MDISLITTGAMTLLQPFLTKAADKAVETIGERLANRALEGNLWQRVKNLFRKNGQEQTLEQIERQPTASSADIALIEEKLAEEMSVHPDSATDILSTFQLSPTSMFIAEQLLKSIQTDRKELVELFEERRRAGVETEGSYDNRIARTRRRLEKDEKEFIKLVTGQ